MGTIFLVLFTALLILICVGLVILVLMQRPNADAGLGASLGGGAAESIFGGETTSTLTRITVRFAVFYFLVSLGLYLGYIYLEDDASARNRAGASIESIEAGDVGTPISGSKTPTVAESMAENVKKEAAGEAPAPAAE